MTSPGSASLGLLRCEIASPPTSIVAREEPINHVLVQPIAAAGFRPPEAGETVSFIESLLGRTPPATGNELQITINLQERQEAQRRHDEVVRRFNNEVATRVRDAIILDRDLTGQTVSSLDNCQPDFGARLDSDAAPITILLESKSLPADAGGQWSQVIIGIGELARYSYEYRRQHDSQPLQILALEREPHDDSLRAFLESLRENNEVAVLWDTEAGFESFESHKGVLKWLFDEQG